jgi:hypothetical protein
LIEKHFGFSNQKILPFCKKVEDLVTKNKLSGAEKKEISQTIELTRSSLRSAH